MRNAHRHTLPVALLALLTAACVTGPGPVSTQDQANFAARKAKAEKMTSKGQLSAALVQWRILESINGGDPVVAEKRRSVEAEIRRRSGRHYENGKSALARGRYTEARGEFLAALAIDPSHEATIEELRVIDARLVRRIRPKMVEVKPMAEKKMAEVEPKAEKVTASKAAAPVVEKQVAPAGGQTAKKVNSEALAQAAALTGKGAYLDSIPLIEKHLSQHPGDDKAQSLLAISHREVGIALYKDGKLLEALSHLEKSQGYANGTDLKLSGVLAEAKSQLAQQSYDKGIRAFRKDVAQAIVFWEETLSYDPNHVKAKSFLHNAYEIQKNLESMSQ